MSFVWYQDVGEFMMNAFAILATKPPDTQNDVVSYGVNAFPLPATDYGKPPTATRAGYLLQTPNEKRPIHSFQSVHNLIQ